MKNKMAEYEKSMAELEDILQKMSADDVKLQESVALYARAAELIKLCAEGLEEARVQIREIDEKMAGMELDCDNGI